MYKERREVYLKSIKEYISILAMRKPKVPKGFPECYYISTSDWYSWPITDRGTSFHFKFPYDIPKRNVILAEVKALGWFELSRRLEKGNDVFYFGHKSYKAKWLKLIFNHNLKGSTCRQVQIGEETVTRTEPIYEIVCDEGAEEEVL